jgi:SpoVK/Ycf46/Vps4 family AAA+-type ATPase
VTDSSVEAESWFPGRPRTVEDTGLSPTLLRDLVLKTIYAGSPVAGFEISRRLRLDYVILESIIKDLNDAAIVQTEGEARHRPQRLERVEEGLTYAITEIGRERARQAMERSAYVGVAPVPLGQYNLAAIRQGLPENFATQERMYNVLSHLVLPEQVLKLLGPALNSRKSIFLYGHSGNGNSSIARATRRLLGEGLYIPWAVAVDDQIIRLLDPGFHEPSRQAPNPRADGRWSSCARPFIQVGGELDMSMLMDEAFIRRIRHKIKIPDPTEEAFREIFRREADSSRSRTIRRRWTTSSRITTSMPTDQCVVSTRGTSSPKCARSRATRASSPWCWTSISSMTPATRSSLATSRSKC